MPHVPIRRQRIAQGASAVALLQGDLDATQVAFAVGGEEDVDSERPVRIDDSATWSVLRATKRPIIVAPAPAIGMAGTIVGRVRRRMKGEPVGFDEVGLVAIHPAHLVGVAVKVTSAIARSRVGAHRDQVPGSGKDAAGERGVESRYLAERREAGGGTTPRCMRTRPLTGLV